MTTDSIIWLTAQAYNTHLQPVFMTANKNDVIIENNGESVSKKGATQRGA